MISLKRCRGKDFSVWIPVIFVLAAVIRVLFLDLKPTHFDEGVNGWFVEQIKTNGTFNYNPENFHGPLYFYLLYVVDFIFGSEIYIHRFVPILCSLGAIFTFYKTSLFLKEKHLAGVLALSLSPALVFYARYSIHESLLLFGFSIWFYGCIELLVKASQKALWLLAIGLAVMATTKETFLIFVINSVIAFLIVRLWQKKPLFADKNKNIDIYLPLTAVVIFIVFLYSELFTSFSQVKEFFTAFEVWKGTGFKHTGHEKSFFYWFDLLFKYEWVFLVGFVVSLPKMLSKNKVQQFMAVYAFGNLLAFSLIPYKTPWCIIALLFPYAFFLASNSKIVQIGVYTVLLAMGIRSIKLNYVDYANPKEAYVYVQTSPKMKEVVDPLRKWIKLHPDEKNLRFLIQTKSEWPLPWLLKDFKAAVYVNVLPDNWKTYDIVVMDRPLFDVVAKPFEADFFRKDFQIRYEQEPSVLLITNGRKDIISIYGGSF